MTDLSARARRRSRACARRRWRDRLQGRAASRGGRCARPARENRHPVPDRHELLGGPSRDAVGAVRRTAPCPPSSSSRPPPRPPHTPRAITPASRLFVISAPDALREFDGQTLVSADEADAPRPVSSPRSSIGDGGDELSYRNLNVAFRAIRRGAEFVAMHRNPWWLTPRGETIDAGAFVAGLEVATGRTPVVCGKPSPVVFEQALAGLAADLGVGRARAGRRGDGRGRPDRGHRRRPSMSGCAGSSCSPARSTPSEADGRHVRTRADAPDGHRRSRCPTSSPR